MFSRFSISIALASTLLFGSAALAAEDKAPLQIFVSKDSQSLVVYDGDQVVATSNVSTGKPGHTTPSGIFSILEKRKTHFSNLYDSAPMPWMQRITWSGVALHESRHVPDYPASHGCVRMPREFAKTLFSMTKRGLHVIISDREVAPHRVTTAELFKPRYPTPEGDLLSDADLRPVMSSDAGAIEVAMAEALPKAGAVAVAALPKAEPPARILITRTSERERIADVQKLLVRLGYEPGLTDGLMSKKTRAAIKAYQELHAQEPTGELSAAFTASIYKVMNRPEPSGMLSVRRNFKPVFSAAVSITDPETALGTHFFQANNVNPAQNAAEWFAVSLDNEIPEKTAKRLGILHPADATLPGAAEAAFARIVISQDVRERLETMLGNGSSMTITDTGTQNETGLGTDFITITRKPKAVQDAG